MSYEGYNEYLCANGHYYSIDALEEAYGDGPFTCPTCATEPVWCNAVDTTNDPGYPYGFDRLREKTPAQNETCPTCQHVKHVAPETYHVPTPEEMLKFHADQEEWYKEYYGVNQ